MLKKFKRGAGALALGICFSVFWNALPDSLIRNTAFAAPSAKAFGELPIAHDAAISPDGRHIAAIVNVKGVYGVFIRPVGIDEKPEFMTLGEGIRPRFIKWASNNRWVVSVLRQEIFRDTPYTMGLLVTSQLNSDEVDVVAKPKGIFRQFNNVVVDWLEDDPKHILMAYSEEQFDPFPDIKKVNLETGRHKTIRRGMNFIEHWMTDDDGTPRIGRGQSEKGNERFIIYNSETERWDDVDEYPGLTYDIDIFGLLNDGRELVVSDYQGKDTLGLYIYDLKERKFTRKLFHNDQYDASGVVLSKDGETVIGAKYVADKDKIELLSENGTLLDRLRDKFKDYSVDFVDQSGDGRTVLVKMSSAFDPGGLYIYNAGDENPRLLSEMYGEISSDDLGMVIPVHYSARDGQKIPAFVTLPRKIQTTEQIKDLPFIILPHGGPYSRDENDFDYFAQFFATRGYGVLQMNFRGSEGYGKSFADAGRSNWVVMQEDVEDGARWLMEKEYADPERTCIAGWSYGGYAALMGVSTDPDLYECAIAMAALTDIDEAKKDLKKYRGGKNAAEEFFGEAFEDKDLRRANSPVNVAENITVPVFLAHGDKDENVQFEQFERMKKALEKAEVEATYLAFEDENHFLSVQKNREKFFVEIEKFLKKVNGSSEYMMP